ncbi:MAG: hybrid sensor histidine kinase/response regulator [Coleofasciculus chthonoplastes F3-SA18-01]|uniref:response regulator n=1 Tax=Coleofasciculus chthonoplastes TaxID=64178 RepID=UPI0032F93C57
MAINPDIRDQAYQFFIAEAPELLQILETGLLNIRDERSTAKVHELMRAAHSLKGGAASVELEAIATLAHRLENIFKALYSDTVDIDVELENKLLQAYDCLSLPLKSQITTGSFNAEAAISTGTPIFDQIEARLGDALTQADSYMPSSAELGINMAVSIFEVDVAEGLERFATVVANPQDYEVAGELRAQLEVFAGFAEFLNLPGFGAIAQTAQQALEVHPERVVEITQLALADFEVSRQAVLSGEPTTGGNPSEALIALAESPATVTVSGEWEASDWGLGLPSTEVSVDMEESVGQPIEAFAEEDAIAPSPEMLPLLADLFSQETEPYTLPATAESPSSIPSLDDIFGTSEGEDILETEEVNEEISILAQIEDHLQATPETVTEVEADVVPETSALVPTEPINLDVAIQSIEQVFDQLPSLEEASQLTLFQGNSLVSNPLDQRNITASSSNKLTSNNPVASTPPRSPAPTPTLSVRVDLDRLERMNNLVGELAINRNGLSLQNQQLQGSVRALLDRFGRFGQIVNQLQSLSDKMLVAPERYSYGMMAGVEARQIPQGGNGRSLGLQTSDRSPDGTLKTLADFDSLEMDSYGALYSQIQGILEEMVQLEEAVDDIALFAKKSDQTTEQQRQMLNHLRDELMWARMLPIGEVLNRFPRVLRELSNTYHKRVNLKLTGTGVLVDKAVLEKLYDPLLHLLRNAFDHGIESAEIRRQRGKPESGQMEIRAYHKGSQTIIEVRDDGQGLNAERIGRRAVELGLVSRDQLATISEAHLWGFIFEPGFSTAQQVSQLSGRGMGLDVVRTQLRSLKGKISVTSTPGGGTTFTLRLPLTLTIAKLLVCFIGTTVLALPSDSIEEIVIPKANQVKKSGAQRFLHWREQLIPTYRLGELLDYQRPLPESLSGQALSSVAAPETWQLPMLVLRQDQQVFAVEVERLVTEQELVIKPFGAAISPPSYTYGCTILGDGSVIPVIDGIALLEFAHGATTPTATPLPKAASEETAMGSGDTPTPSRTVQVSTILIVDDAVALRQTLALTLERAGFRVLQARDGREAIEQLQQSASVQLVVCDIEMPNMNGFEFLSQRRQDPQLSSVPVAMLTSRSSQKHRWLAMQLGASGYFTKPYLEQEFVGSLKDIIRENSLVSH